MLIRINLNVITISAGKNVADIEMFGAILELSVMMRNMRDVPVKGFVAGHRSRN